MLEELKQEANYTLTENGALTHASTLNCCLDLFSGIGALRHVNDEEIIRRFQRAYAENAELAMKCLFFARDIRGGLGERRTFRVILKWLAYNHAESVVKNLQLVAEFGRYDDLLELLETPCSQAALQVIGEQLRQDRAALQEGRGKDISLLGKWLPSINASSQETIRRAKLLVEYLHLDYKTYRKLLAALRAEIKIIENNLRLKDYSFDYSQQPSKAMLKYRKAFWRNDEERYCQFLDKVNKGEAKLHTGTLAPYDIIAPIIRGYGYYWGNQSEEMSAEERKALDTTWNAQEDFTGDENALVVVDGSGSMYGWDNPTPAAVAQSLGIYFAERNQGHFHNHFITFSATPRLVEIKGQDIVDKVQYCMGYDECSNTNLAAVFELLLATAVKHHLPQREMPSRLYIISDMEFDCCDQGAELTNFQYAKAAFEAAGYKLPEVVFWNVAARNSQVPVTKNEQGVALVSGNSPHIFQMLKGGLLDPLSFMLEVLNGERYAKVVIS